MTVGGEGWSTESRLDLERELRGWVSTERKSTSGMQKERGCENTFTGAIAEGVSLRPSGSKDF